MKILVTGATGFIGRHVIRQLLDLEYTVIATARSEESQEDLFEESDQVKFIPADLHTPKGNWFTYFEEPDALIHLAWAGLPNYTDIYHFETNLPRQFRFLKNLVENGLSEMTITGTCFEYGIRSGSLTETMQTDPANPYALAKDCLRRFMEQLQNHRVFDCKWIRLFYMYGPGQRSNALIPQLDRAFANDDAVFNMSGGEQLRDYLHVKNVAEYIIKIAIQNEVTGIINCCSGTPISVRKLVEDYIESRGGDIRLNLGYYPYPTHEPMAFWGDATKLNTILQKE